MKNNSFTNLTPISTYWLGFIAADGCVYKSRSGQLTLSIALQSRDLKHLCLLKKFLKCKNKVTKRPETKSFVLRVGNKGMCEDLMSLGVTPNKSKTNTNLLEHIPDNMKDYFIAGFFDGDGSVFAYTSVRSYKNKTYTYKRCAVTIVNNQNSLIAIIDHLKKYYNFRKLSIDKNGSIYRLRWDIPKDILEFYKLYKKSDLHLKRKMIKYNKEIKKIKQKKEKKQCHQNG